MAPPRLHWGEATHVGRVRTDNEDASLSNEHVIAVADGMGGHRGGEVASRAALAALESNFRDHSRDGLTEAAHVANDIVFERSNDDPNLRGMGTTLVALAPVDEPDDEAAATGGLLLAWVHVGDSRIYRLHDGELEQLTEDHSLVEQWVREGSLSPEEAREHPQRNILTRALGIGAEVGIDSGTVIAYPGDRFLLCSDGLFNELDEPRIASVLRRLADAQDAADELVRLAVEHGGRDNVTVAVVDVTGDEDEPGRLASAAIAGGTVEGRAGDPPTSAQPAVAPPLSRHEAGKRRERPRLVTWRVVVFVVLFVLILVGGLATIGYQARHSYFVGFQGDSVVVFKGKPGGVLWFHPTVEERTGLTRADVPESERDRVNSGQEESSLGAAHDYVDFLRQHSPSSTTTTTTTTTTPAVVPTLPTIPPTTA